MPPLPIPPVPASVQSWPTLLTPRHLIEATILVSVFVTTLRSLYLVVEHGKRRMPRSSMSREDSFIDQKKATSTKQRKDSSHDEELRIAIEVDQEKRSTADGDEDNMSLRPSLDKEPNQYLQSLRNETLQPSRLPIYPWIALPQPLPGPYDAPYYPLPLPTIKSEILFQVNPISPTVKVENSSDEVPEELESISYTRRVSTNSIPDKESLLEGSVTVSTKGWKRTQWTVIAG
jgi:hypothetical protein